MFTCSYLVTLVTLGLPGSALGHATLISPDPRGQDGNLWYQVGCQIGCTCSGSSSKELYKDPESFGCQNPKEPTNNAAGTRTWNVHSRSPRGDFTKYNPWRAPGSAVPLNGCGIASGFVSGGFERIDFTGERNFYSSAVPPGFSAGEPGTNVPSSATPTVWKAGGIAEVSFGIEVNHGGGYQYRLCPKSEEVAESCFQSNPLTFATKNHTIRYNDGSRPDFQIPAVDITEGVMPAGSAWRRFPVPACNCDIGTGCSEDANDAGYVPYSTGAGEKQCPTGLQFPKSWEDGYGYSGFEIMPDDGKSASESTGENQGKESEKEDSKDDDIGWMCYELGEENCDSNAKCSISEKSGKKYCWSKDKRLLYEAARTDEPNVDTGDHEHRMLAAGNGTYVCSKCGYVYNPEDFQGLAFLDQPDSMTCPNCGSPRSFFQTAGGDGAYSDALGRASTLGYLWHTVDYVQVPDTPGDYVLSWRWDCEQTPQIWTNCADVTIEAAPESSAGPLQLAEGMAMLTFLVAYSNL